MINHRLIHILKQYNILTHDNTLGRKYMRVLTNIPELMQMVLNETTYFKTSASPKERLHAILLGLTKQPVCKSCGQLLRMRLSGRFMYTFPTFCSSKCSSSDIDTIQKRTSALLLKRDVVGV